MGLSASIGGIRAESRSSAAALDADATLDSGAKGAGSALSWLDVEATDDPVGELLLLVPAAEVDPVPAVVLPAEADPDPPDPDPLLVELVLVVVVVLSLFGVGAGVGSEIVLVPPDFGVAVGFGVGVGVGVGEAVAVGAAVGDGQLLWHFPASAVDVPARMNSAEVAAIRPATPAARRPRRSRSPSGLAVFAVIDGSSFAPVTGLKTWS